MIYQLNGKFGPFTLEADDNLKILACQYKLASDHSVYTSDPVIIASKVDHVTFNIEIQKYFENGLHQYIDDNLIELISILNNFVPGYRAERIEFQKAIEEINAEDISDEDKLDAIKMIKSAYQNMYQENNLNLFNRVEQVSSLLEFRLKEIAVPNIVEEQDESV